MTGNIPVIVGRFSVCCIHVTCQHKRGSDIFNYFAKNYIDCIHILNFGISVKYFTFGTLVPDEKQLKHL